MTKTLFVVLVLAYASCQATNSSVGQMEPQSRQHLANSQLEMPPFLMSPAGVGNAEITVISSYAQQGIRFALQLGAHEQWINFNTAFIFQSDEFKGQVGVSIQSSNQYVLFFEVDKAQSGKLSDDFISQCGKTANGYRCTVCDAVIIVGKVYMIDVEIGNDGLRAYISEPLESFTDMMRTDVKRLNLGTVDTVEYDQILRPLKFVFQNMDIASNCAQVPNVQVSIFSGITYDLGKLCTGTEFALSAPRLVNSECRPWNAAIIVDATRSVGFFFGHKTAY